MSSIIPSSFGRYPVPKPRIGLWKIIICEKNIHCVADESAINLAEYFVRHTMDFTKEDPVRYIMYVITGVDPVTTTAYRVSYLKTLYEQ